MVSAEIKGWEPGGDPAPQKRKRSGNIQCFALLSTPLHSGRWSSSHCSSLILASLEMAPLGGEKPSCGCVKPGPGLLGFSRILPMIRLRMQRYLVFSHCFGLPGKPHESEPSPGWDLPGSS